MTTDRHPLREATREQWLDQCWCYHSRASHGGYFVNGVHIDAGHCAEPECACREFEMRYPAALSRGDDANG